MKPSINLISYLCIICFSIIFSGCCLFQDCDSDCEELIGDESITFEYYNDGDPNITATSENSGNVFFGNATAEDVGNDVNIKIPGISIKSNSNNYEVTNFIIYERKDDCFKIQSEFDPGSSSSVKTNIASVLVLDMSTSLEPIMEDLKSYAKKSASTIVNSSSNSLVAVVFFADKNSISETSFYGAGNINQLLTEIDNYNNYQSRTALFEATIQGLELINDLTFSGEKSLVIFSDGGDNDSDNPSVLKNEIQNSLIRRYTIGLEGTDFNESDLKDLTSDSGDYELAETEADLEGIFEKVVKGVISVYELNYKRSDQQLSKDESIEIRIQMQTNKIE